MKKGSKHTKEARERISLVQIGKKLSKETKRNMSLAHVGQIPWNKGLKGVQIAWNKGIPFSEETRKRMSLSAKGKPKPWFIGNKHRLGQKQTEETKQKIRENTLN